jgi:hypothetical protein
MLKIAMIQLLIHLNGTLFKENWIEEQSLARVIVAKASFQAN